MVQSGGPGQPVTIFVTLPVPTGSGAIPTGGVIEGFISFGSTLPSAMTGDPLFGVVVTGAENVQS